MTKYRCIQLLTLVALLTLVLVRPNPGHAQGVSAATASILGTVSDPAGGVVPGVSITVTNTDTGISQQVTTDKSGRYAVHFLPPGPYSLSASVSAFKTETRSGIVLTVGQQAVIDLTLQVGERKEVVNVTGAAPLVNTTASETSYLVSDTTIRDLPLNGRDFVQLALLQPGVSSIASISGNSEVTTGGTAGNTNGGKFSVNGQPSKAVTYLIDGSDVSDPFGLIPTLGGVSGAALGVEAIKEFRIITNDYTAAYGRHAGGVVEAITRSGTNDLHGGAFDFLRNSAVDAKNFFDDPTRRIPEFRRNQFGFNLGGPIVRDRTFIFGDYEGLRELLGVTQTFASPDSGARSGNLGRNGMVTVDPRIRPFLALYPLPNGLDFGDGTGIVKTSSPQPINEDYFLIRVDHQLGSNDRLFARYLFDDGRSTNPLESTVVPGFPGKVNNRNQFFAIGEQKSFSPTIVNAFQFSYSRQKALGLPIETTPGVETSLIPGQPLGQVVTFGLPTIGNVFTIPIGEFNNILQYSDNLSMSRGKHFLKFGADIRRVQNNGPFALAFLGEYQFADLAHFLQAAPSIFLGAVPGNANSDRGYRLTDWGFYVQDDFSVAPRFTVNLGLRYEGSSDPSEATGRIANVIHPLTDTAPTAGKLLSSPKHLFAPRIGFAWSPDQKTAIRAGYGIFYSFLSINEYSDTRFLPPFYQILLSVAPTFLNPTSGAFVIPSFGITVPTQFDYQQPNAQEFNATVQREISSNFSVQAAYVGGRGYHLLRSGNLNTPVPQIVNGRVFFPTGAPRRNPNFGAILFISSDAQSEYNSLQLSAQKRFSRGLQFQASYTWSRSIDDASGPFLSDFITQSGPVQNYFCRTCDRGLSAWDTPHNFVFNWIYELPFGPNKPFLSGVTGGATKLVGGWSIGGIVALHSGLPFTPVLGFNNSNDGSIFLADRPDVVGPCRILGNPSRWFDPSCFAPPPAGTYGNAGRDILKGPDFKNVDFVLSKETSITEKARIQFRAEFFNLFNHPNFAPPINSTGFNGLGGNGEIIFNAGSSTPLPTAGQIFSTANTSRQIQFGLKFLF